MILCLMSMLNPTGWFKSLRLYGLIDKNARLYSIDKIFENFSYTLIFSDLGYANLAL